MALILTAVAAYAAYSAAQQGDSEPSVPEVDESIDLSGKTWVDLLPLEVTLECLEAPLCTITFMKGNYQDATAFIRKRVADVVYRNPYLGGWLIRKPGEKFPKLVFDPSSDNLCEGIIEVLEPGEVNLSFPETPYKEYGATIGKKERIKVLATTRIINRNKEPLFRVAVVPDALHPSEKFALVVSMSHQCGDLFTYYRILDMLVSSKVCVEALNPNRKHSFSDAIMNRMGRQEAHYVRNAFLSPTWEWGTDKEESTMHKKVFFVSNEWLDREKAKAQKEGQDDNIQLSNGAIISSWFFNLAQPTVAFIPYNFRNRLPNCNVTNSDAGTYVSAVPYTSVDYATPGLIEKSFSLAKRCGSGDEPPPALPPFQRGASYSLAVDSSYFSSVEEILPSDREFQPVLHMPLYDSNDLEVLPSKLSYIDIFLAAPSNNDNHVSERIGAFVMATASVMSEVETCGIVDEVITDF